MPERRLRIGVAGLGRAFTLMLPTLAADSRLELVAAADPRAEATGRFAADFGARVYVSVDELCADEGVEVVYVATPHQHNVCLIVGHSHSFDHPILRTREIIDSGTVGRVQMINAQYYTDFLYRPRRPEEFSTASGGGVVFSQGAHQVDMVRLLGGGHVKSVRALTGAWDPARPTEGAYAALLSFADGAFASLVYSGYAHFDADEFCGGIGELGTVKKAGSYGAARRNLERATNAVQEAALKQARNYGGVDYPPPGAAAPTAPWHEHFGVVLVSCEHADLRPLPTGVMIYGDAEARLESLAKPTVPRAEVVDELYDAIVHGRRALHDGRWAMATLEVCLAILESARDQREITLRHQVGFRR